MKKRAYLVVLAALVALMVASGASAKKSAGFHGVSHTAHYSARKLAANHSIDRRMLRHAGRNNF